MRPVPVTTLNSHVRQPPVVVDWNGDGTYTPTCGWCEWRGKPRPKHHEAVAAVRSHYESKRHRDVVRGRDVAARPEAI